MADKRDSDDLGLMTISKVESRRTFNNSELNTVAPPTPFNHQSSIVEELQLENSKLTTALKKTQKELEAAVTAHQDEQQTFAGSGCGKSSVVGKVVELSRKNRSLNAELAAEQNKVKQLEGKLREVIEQHSQKKEELVETKLHKPPSSNGNRETKTIAIVEEQLKEALAKSTEYRNQYQVVKQELKVALKVLNKEVGEGVNVSSLLGTTSGWRGRAQQIIALQNKVTELKQQLQSVKQSSGSETSITLTRRQSQSGGINRQMSTLRKMEKQKQQSLECVSTELESLKEQHGHLEHQFNALKARNKNLTIELKQVKQQLSSLHDKSKHDENLIAMLRLKQKETDQQKHMISAESNDEQQQQHFQQLLLRKDEEIKKLNKQISHMRSVGPDSRDTVVNRQLSAPPTARVSNSTVIPKLLASHNRETLSTPEIEQMKTQLQVLTVERDKLMELVACMQDRMDEAVNAATKLQADLQIQRRKNALQEKRLLHHQGGVTKSKCTENSMEDLEDQLMIQKDENKVLKDCLLNLRQNKQKDTKMMHELLLQSRELYLESIKRITQQLPN
ncbi:coiled-coil domain-containing protein 13-like [Dysidea avara]|uniref:coiled-coil domain-containing protein 13-like n=1 Tax=Dysidea avara TaxID=196820 RepID=UPI003330212B